MAEIYRIGSDDLVDRVSTFGGTNLLVNSKQMQLGTSSWVNGVWRLAGNANMTKSRIEITDSPIGTCGAFQLVGTQTTTTDTSCFGIDNWQPWTTTDYYTISMYARVTSGTGMAGIQNGSGYSKTLVRTNADTTWGSYACLTLTSNWQRIWVVYLPTAISSNIYIGGAGTNATIQMCGIKIEKGSKPTDWTPAPHDFITYDSSSESLVFFQ